MKKSYLKPGHGARVGALLAAALLAACVPLFTGGAFQTLRLVFETDRAFEAGSETVVHSAVFAEAVEVRKKFVQVSGRVTATGGAPLPSKVTVKAAFEAVSDGRKIQNVTLALSIGEDGTFRAAKKLKKDIGAGEMLVVTLEPAGADLAVGSEIIVCVDLVGKKGDLRRLSPCLEDDDESGGDAERLSALQTDFLTPTCARAGCHSMASAEAGLVLAAGQSFGNLVGVASSQVPSLNRVQPGDADNSYLVKKLRGDGDIQGERMPRGGPFLSVEQIARFSSWINAGAADN